MQTWSGDGVNMDFQGKEKEVFYFRSEAGRKELAVEKEIVRYMDKAPGTGSQITLHNTLGKLPIIDTQKAQEELTENQENHNVLRK